MKYYVTINHPITGEEIKVVPTGKKDGLKIEGKVITPKAGIDTIWFNREDLSTPQQELTPL